MTRTLSFYGASDDLFECVDSAGKATDEIGCYDRPGAYRITITRGDETFGLLVVGFYDVPKMPKAIECWSVAVCPLGEDMPIPSWPVAMATEKYSARLTITVPDDAVCVPAMDAEAVS